MDIIILSAITAFSLLVVLTKLMGLHRVLKYQKIIDVLTTFALPWAFYGSFSGMATAIFAGIILSIVLGVMGKLHNMKGISLKLVKAEQTA